MLTQLAHGNRLRLACMQVIFHDFEYAVEKKAEHTLWQAHTSVNTEYRRVVGRLGGQSQVVQKRKVERMYKDFLKTSQSFYCGYVQRLASRFSIPELSQAAQGLQVRPVDPPSSRETSLADPMHIRVTDSCQRSLVHLGDLARYRCQVSDKSTKTSFDTALAYYGLANAVDPDNGSAHHQMAVLYQLQARHFDIVYHFHRAIAIAKPHELGLGNLDREYRGLNNPSPSQVGAPANVMVTWFVRLHGFYSQGEAFSQQVELETEVLHRTERAYKAGSLDQPLLRMALINIAAYEIGTNKVKEAWTLTASRTCQFLLRWTIRSIIVLVRLTKTELQDDLRRALASAESPEGIEQPTRLGSGTSGYLGLLRIYVAWIYTVRSDIVEYRDFLEPHVSDAYRLLADTLTLLNNYCQKSRDTVPSSYLLAEDMEAVGLRPLEDRRLPLFFHVLEKQGVLASTKRYKARKPRKDVAGVNHDEHVETVWRVRDIICCGILLAGSAHFPVSITAVKYPDGRQTEGWIFTEEHPAASYITEAEMTCMLERLERPGFEGVVDEQISRVSPTPPSPHPVAHSRMPTQAPVPHDEKLADHAMKNAVNDRPVTNQSKSEKPMVASGESDINQDDEMLDMVNKLLDPTDEKPVRNGSTYQESSYGLDTSIVNDIFGHIPQNSGHVSPVAREIPSLPWEHFYNASWKESTGLSRGQPAADRSSPNTASLSARKPSAPSPESAAGLRSNRHVPDGQSRDPALSRWLPSSGRAVDERLGQTQRTNLRHVAPESFTQTLHTMHAKHTTSSRPLGTTSMLSSGDPRLAPSGRTSGADRSFRTADRPSPHELKPTTALSHQEWPRPSLSNSDMPPLTQSPDSRSHAPSIAAGIGNFSARQGDKPTQAYEQRSQVWAHPGSDSKQSASPSFNLAGHGHNASHDLRSSQVPGSVDASMTFSHPSSLFGGTPDAVFVVPRAELQSHHTSHSGFSSGSASTSAYRFSGRESRDASI